MSLASTHSREHGNTTEMACGADPSRRTGQTARVVVVAWLLALACALSMLGVSASVAMAASGLVWGSVSEVGPPAGAPSGERMLLTHLSCPAAGDCVAIGTLEPKHELQALVVEETNGVWGKAAFVELPEASKVTHSQLASIDCRAVGDCTAVGFDEVVAEKPQAIVVSESGGNWEAAQIVQPPATSERATLASVACTGPGSCTAVGESRNASTHKYEAVAVEETNGTWGAAVAVPQPADAKPDGGLQSVSCPTTGVCAATGWYYSETTHSYDLMGANEAGGVWTSEGITVPNNEFNGEYTRLYVSCQQAGSCGASGYYHQNALVAYRAIGASYAGGKWSSSAQLINTPAGNEYTYLYAPSCPASSSCSAVGDSYTPVGENYELLVASSTGGVWGGAETVPMPSNFVTETEAKTLEVERYGELYGVSCWAVGACESVGEYTTQTGEYAAMAASETGGVWNGAEEIAPPSNAKTGTQGEAWLNEVSCTAGGTCGAVGSYKDGADELRGMTASAASAAEPPSSSPPVGQAPSGPAPSKPSAPAVAIVSSKLSAAKGEVQVRLACRVTACKGIVKIVAVTTIRARRKGKTVTEKQSVVLASGGYKIAAGKTQAVTIKLTANGRKLLAKLARHHALRVKLTVTVTGGAAKSEAVKLS